MAKAGRRGRILRWIAGIIGVAQLVQPDRSPIASDPAHDLVAITHPSQEVADLLHMACYDCHGSTTSYPWYSYITPVNWWLQDHVNEGREEGNLSEWGTMPERQLAHFVDEAAELIEDGEMPQPSYTWMHGEARLDQRQRKLLIDFFQGLPEAAIEWRRERRRPG